MKNVRQYEKKIRKLLKGMQKVSPSVVPPEEVLWAILHAILDADAAPHQADKALHALRAEFVDLNEMRVAIPKEIQECLGKGYPFARRKAEMIPNVLNGIFYRTSELSAEYLADMGRRELRRHLLELGLAAYESALVLLRCFDEPAVPVDLSLRECLELNGLTEPGSDEAAVQAMLERVVPSKDSYSAHCFFRSYVVSNAKALARKRKADAEEAARRAAEEARLAAEAEAARRAAAEARARAEAEKLALQQAKPKPRKERPQRKARPAGKARKAPAAAHARKRTGKTKKKK